MIGEDQVGVIGAAFFVAGHDDVFSPGQRAADGVVGAGAHDQDAGFFCHLDKHFFVGFATPVDELVFMPGDFAVYRKGH